MSATGRYHCTVCRIIDGDSLVACIDLGLDVILTNVHCRLVGIDTPELHHSDPANRARAQLARIRLSQLLPDGSDVILESGGSRDKYGRLLADLYPDGSALTAGQILVAEGLARPYSGGPRGEAR